MNTVISYIGVVLDFKAGKSDRRWQLWRPNVALCHQRDFHVDRLHLLVEKKYDEMNQFIVDDIHAVSPDTEVVLEYIEVDDPWNFESVYASLFDLAERMEFHPEKEDYYVHLSTGTHVAQICLFLLAESRHFPAKLLQTMPGEPRTRDTAIGSISIIDLDLSNYDQIAARFAAKTTNDVSYLKSGIETKNAGFNKLIDRIERVAVASVDPILITGPTGAGKSLLARKIYDLRKQRLGLTGSFVEVNCATLRADMAMATLFGHVKGSFTGAEKDRPGLLRAADGGILFLDEIGELGLDEQAALLHAIEEKRFLPVGSDVPVESSFQLLCGTNRDLKQRIAEKKFREDLYSRINLWTFPLPALADRLEDIAPNVEYELNQFTQRTGKRTTFNAQAQQRFLEFAVSPEASWRGNFRDLNAAITRMGTLAMGGRIDINIVNEEIARLKELWKGWGDNSSQISKMAVNEDTLRRFDKLCKLKPALAELDRFDQGQLLDVLSVCWNSSSIANAGRVLFANSRQQKKIANDSDRLRKYLLKFDLDWETVKGISN